jgi:hypothetical protein
MLTTKGYKIKHTSEFSYTWKVNGDYKYDLYFSVSKTKLLSNSFYDDETNTLIFSAESAERLSDYLDTCENGKMDYLSVIRLIHSISKQMIYLHENNFSFFGFDLDDILVVDKSLFFVASSNYLLPIVDQTNIVFYNPIKMPYFSNPELFQIHSIPSEINYKCSYYSLGLLVVYCLLNNYLLVGNQIKTDEEIEKALSAIKYTKMYWFLNRCMNSTCEKRILLFF